MDLGRKRAKVALRLCIFTMALYGCALIIYVTFRMKYGEEKQMVDVVGEEEEDVLFLGY